MHLGFDVESDPARGVERARARSTDSPSGRDRSSSSHRAVRRMRAVVASPTAREDARAMASMGVFDDASSGGARERKRGRRTRRGRRGRRVGEESDGDPSRVRTIVDLVSRAASRCETREGGGEERDVERD